MTRGVLIIACYVVLNQMSAVADKSDIVKAWSERQKKFELGATFEIEIATRFPAGGFTRTVARQFPDVNSWPRSDSTRIEAKRIIIQRHCIRTEDLKPFELPLIASANESVLQLVSRTETFNGSESRGMLIESGMKYPQEAVVFDKRQLNDAETIALHPLFVATVPLNHNLTKLDPTTMKVIEEKVRGTDGIIQTILEFGGSASVFRYRLWTDDKADLSPSRVEFLRSDGRARWAADLEYEESDDLGFIPKAWTHTTFDAISGDVTSSARVTVTRVELTRVLPSDCFELRFPPGSVIDDLRQGEQHYLVAEDDGRLTSISEEQARRLRSERVPPILRKSSTSSGVSKTLIAINGITVAIILVVVWWNSKCKAT